MSRTVELVTERPEVTRTVAATLASRFEPGDVVSLTGELGAGKTCFVQGAAAALGVTDRVTSPTFLLRRDYEGRLPITHLDVYRLETLGDVLDVGYGEDDRRVVLVEWGDAMRPLLPADHLEVELSVIDPSAPVDSEGEPRRLRVVAHGDSWARRLADLEGDLAPWLQDEAS